jgi:hypothetical protein
MVSCVLFGAGSEARYFGVALHEGSAVIMTVAAIYGASKLLLSK